MYLQTFIAELENGLVVTVEAVHVDQYQFTLNPNVLDKSEVKYFKVALDIDSCYNEERLKRDQVEFLGERFLGIDFS